MATCFVIQPFDSGKFDKRYDDVFKPAIEAADLEPYRVDRDPAVNVPINQIEDGIRVAAACLADITEDNPNVWFEVGYAIAATRPLCLICSEERTTKFPFDIQHRSIIRYKVGSTSDFDQLNASITDRLKALLKQQNDIKSISSLGPTTSTEGLSPHEVTAMAVMMGSLDDDGLSTHYLKQHMEQAGFTDVATGIAIQALRQKGFAEKGTTRDMESGEFYPVCRLTDAGSDWLVRNQDKLVLRLPREPDPPF